jgi:RHS repeat-associated protein
MLNPYLYNGKELNSDFGLDWSDYGARYYDAAIGRWNSVDPLAHVMPSWSPYTFVFNNPLSYIDPDGRIPYPITVRSFAPFNYFGGGFHGDGANRGFTTSSTATARIHQTINFDTDKTQLKTNVWSSPSSHRFLPGTITGSPTVSIDNFTIANNGDSKTFNFGTHSKGSNPFIPGSPNIDVLSNFSITESNGLLSVSGDLKGDNFPSTEAFITDPNGSNVFIGVGFYEGSPFSSLDGENKRDITSFSFGIQTDKKGNFTGVQYNGTDYSIGDWNKLFEQADPHKNEQE